MTIVTHTVIGLAIGTVINKVINHDYGNLTIIGFSIFFALLPDINILWKNLKNHHKDITHYFSFWLILSIIMFLIETTISDKYIFSTLFFTNIFSHILLDCFGFRNGMYLFYPFNNKELSFTKIQPSKDISLTEYFKLYIKNWNLFFEVVFIAIGIVAVLI